MTLRPFFCRMGNKKWIAKEVLHEFPENYENMIYVEPFVGGGSIFFSKKQSKVEILNDMDNTLIDGYRLIRESNMEDIEKYKIGKSLEWYRKFVLETGGSNTDKLAREIVKKNNTYRSVPDGKIYQTTNPYFKLKNLDKYQERMKNTKLYSGDYKTVMEKYDSINTLHYLDPPYEKSRKHYIHSKFDFKECAQFLKTIKGKFLLSINDSENIRDIFKDFKFHPILVQKGSGHKGEFREELFISNYGNDLTA